MHHNRHHYVSAAVDYIRGAEDLCLERAAEISRTSSAIIRVHAPDGKVVGRFVRGRRYNDLKSALKAEAHASTLEILCA